MLKILQIGVGVIIIMLGIFGLVNGEIQGLGPLGIGDTIYLSQNPMKYWINIIGIFGAGILIIYYVVRQRD